MASRSQPPQRSRLVLGIAGCIGAGKTSAGKYLSTTRGFQYLRYSQVLTEWLANDPERKAHLQEVGWQVMEGGMQAELNNRLIAQIRSDRDVAIDGLRHPTDYQSLKNCSGNSFFLLYIDTARNYRWEHLKGHSRYKSLSEFEAADSHPVEQQIELLRANATRVIHNEGSLQDLYESLDETVRDLKKEGQS